MALSKLKDTKYVTMYFNCLFHTFQYLPDYDIDKALACTTPGLIDSHCHIDFILRRLENPPPDFNSFCAAYPTTFPKSLTAFVAVYCEPRLWMRVRISKWNVCASVMVCLFSEGLGAGT